MDGNATWHTGGQVHHHHSHARASRHEQGHHLLQVSRLSVSFRMYDPAAPFFSAQRVAVKAIDDLSISVHAGEIVAVVGASGSGKTLLADAVMGIFEPNALVEGEVWFDGEPVDAAGLSALRGRPGGIALVPQGVASLDPLMRVGAQVDGPVKRPGLGKRGGRRPASGDGRFLPRSQARAARQARAEKREALFERYGLAPEVARMYPHQLSGGMARRVLLCTALMDDPKLIIADEPTPGLDLELAVAALADFRAFADAGGGVMLITHDVELALRVADRVAVFEDGTVVEETATASFASPELLEHPFSRALWHALPEHDFAVPGRGGRAAAEPAAAPSRKGGA